MYVYMYNMYNISDQFTILCLGSQVMLDSATKSIVAARALTRIVSGRRGALE